MLSNPDYIASKYSCAFSHWEEKSDKLLITFMSLIKERERILQRSSSKIPAMTSRFPLLSFIHQHTFLICSQKLFHILGGKPQDLFVAYSDWHLMKSLRQDFLISRFLKQRHDSFTFLIIVWLWTYSSEFLVYSSLIFIFYDLKFFSTT